MEPKALLIGILYKDNKGGFEELDGPQNDVKMMEKFLREDWGYRDIRLMVDDGEEGHIHPTRQAIMENLAWLVKDATSESRLFLHYSGHGDQLPTKDMELEPDGRDEAIIPVDYQTNGMIIDDELYEALVPRLPAGCRLTALFDCCHSGTLMDLEHYYPRHTDLVMKWAKTRCSAIDSPRLTRLRPRPKKRTIAEIYNLEKYYQLQVESSSWSNEYFNNTPTPLIPLPPSWSEVMENTPRPAAESMLSLSPESNYSALSWHEERLRVVDAATYEFLEPYQDFMSVSHRDIITTTSRENSLTEINISTRQQSLLFGTIVESPIQNFVTSPTVSIDSVSIDSRSSFIRNRTSIVLRHPSKVMQYGLPPRRGTFHGCNSDMMEDADQKDHPLVNAFSACGDEQEVFEIGQNGLLTTAFIKYMQSKNNKVSYVELVNGMRAFCDIENLGRRSQRFAVPPRPLYSSNHRVDLSSHIEI